MILSNVVIIFAFMEEIKRGGKRAGAGRKPLLNKKKQITLYVENGKILSFGGEDKMKSHLYGVIDGYKKDVPKIETHPAFSEIVKQSTATPEIVKQTQKEKTVAEWIKEKQELETPEQFEVFCDELAASSLSTRQKKMVELA